MGSPLQEVNQKPAVILTVKGEVPTEFLRALKYGLEEEGIPCERRDEDAADAVAAASRAARDSRINVGLGISPAATVLHHRDLPESRPLFTLTEEEMTVEALYRFGRNAARLVKGNPFIMAADGKPGEQDSSGTRKTHILL